MFRRENKTESFDRQMDALRDQLGDGSAFDDEEPMNQADQQPEPYAPAQAPPDRARDYGFGQAAVSGRQRQPVVEPEPETPEAPSVPETSSKTTVIAGDAQWKGDIVSEGDVHIFGRFDGSVRAKVAIFVAEGAEVDATLSADAITVAGSTKGSVRAQSRFEVHPSGRVAGDIVSPTLVVHEGATIAGQLRMAAGEAATPAAPESTPTPVVQRRAARGTA